MASITCEECPKGKQRVVEEVTWPDGTKQMLCREHGPCSEYRRQRNQASYDAKPFCGTSSRVVMVKVSGEGSLKPLLLTLTAPERLETGHPKWVCFNSPQWQQGGSYKKTFIPDKQHATANSFKRHLDR